MEQRINEEYKQALEGGDGMHFLLKVDGQILRLKTSLEAAQKETRKKEKEAEDADMSPPPC